MEENFVKRYSQMENNGFPMDMQLSFSYDIGHSKEIEYHYSIIKDVWFKKKPKIINIENWFDAHYEAGLDYIIQQTEKEISIEEKVYACYLAASVLSSLHYKSYAGDYGEYNKIISEKLVSLIEIDNAELRRKIIIALGWVGSINEIDLLLKLVLHNDDSLCRAWASTALMQMSFHKVSKEAIQEKSTGTFIEALSNEQDYYACGCMVYTIQTLFSKHWISQTAVEDVEKEKIDKAKKSAVRFLKKVSAS